MRSSLRADLRAKGKERATQNLPVLLVCFQLRLDDMIDITADAIERRNRRSEKLVDQRLAFPPPGVDRRHRQVGLGIEKIIKASLPDSRALTNRIDGHGTVAVFPDQIMGCIHQPLPSITGSSHNQSPHYPVLNKEQGAMPDSQICDPLSVPPSQIAMRSCRRLKTTLV